MSGGGSKNQNVTQTSEPPAYIRPFLNEAATASSDLFRQGPQQYYPGETVVPFAAETESSLSGTAARAASGSPVNQAATDYTARTLGSVPTSQYGSGVNPYAGAANPFGGAKNPYLDAAFNRAADSVQNRLQSGFAGAGRNIEAARPVAAQELNDLATGIYGGAYDAERNRQLQYQ